MQITPDVCWRKNAMASGVANSAAMMRSPSFSRSSSSTTTTISPRPIAATALSMSANGISVLQSASLARLWRDELFHVLGDQVDFEVHLVPALTAAERGDLGGVRNDGDGEPVVECFGNREAHTVDGDRALLDHVTHQLSR